LHGYGFKPWRTYINFIFFGIFGFDLNMERWKGNLSEWAAKGGWKGSRRGGAEWHINAIFVLGLIT